jgi:hypothetical protein
MGRSRSESESEMGAEYVGADPKPTRSIHGQVEAGVTPGGGPNRCGLKTARMSCG